jgi:mRNA interferase HigB
MGTVYNIVMHIIAKKRLLEYCEQYPDAREQLLAWYADAKRSNWAKSLDVKDVYGDRVSFVGKRAVFDIKGNSYRLVVIVEYRFKKVFIRWFGPHADYDKIDIASI